MNNQISRNLAIAVLAFAPLWGMAVEPYTPVMADPLLEPWRWQHEEALDGLKVLCMDEAEDGTLWFGCAGNLANYNGDTVIRIPFDEELLSKVTHREKNPWAKALVILRNSDPLLLIGESLVLRTANEWTVIIQDVGTSVFSPQLTQSDDGTIWLTVPDALWRISEDLTETEKVIEADPSFNLMSSCHDPRGDLWVLKKTGKRHSALVHIPIQNGVPVEASEWREIPVPFEYKELYGLIVADEEGLIWYSDSINDGSGLEAYDPANDRWLDRDSENVLMDSYSLLIGQDQSIWCGLEGRIARLTPAGEFLLYENEQLQLPVVPLLLHETRNGRLWVIGRTGYVYSVDISNHEWETYAGLNFHCETEDGIQWFIAKSRMHVITHDTRSREWLQYGPEDHLIEDAGLLMRSSHGLIWVAGSHQGRAALSVFNGSDWTQFRHPEFAQWIEPNAAFEASDGTVWFGAGGGILTDVEHAGGALQYEVENGGKVRLLKHHAPPDFPYYVTAFTQTSDDVLWVGSTLLHRTDGSSAGLRSMHALPRDNTIKMAVVQGDALWVAKELFGIYRREGDVWTNYTTEDGLAGTMLSDLLVLHDDTILAATDQGISRFDGRVWTKQVYSDWFGMSKRWSGLRESKDGAVWLNFAGEEIRSPQIILNKNEPFCTIRHKPETTPPDTRILHYLDRVAQPGNSHVIWTAHDPWGKTPHDQMQYSWRLNGGDWSDFSHDTSKTFLELDRGRHVLEVRARDAAFNVDPMPARVGFTVIAPLWLQPWFVGMILLFTSVVAAFIWLLIHNHEKRLKDRERHLVEIDQLKTGFFTNLSHELRTPLTVMLGPIENLLRIETNDTKRQLLSMVQRSAGRVSNLMSQMLDFRKLEQGVMELEMIDGNIAQNVRESIELLQPMAEAHKVLCRTDDVYDCNGWFDPDTLRKIVSNLVGNALKYTPAGGEVHVSLTVDRVESGRRALLLSVEDNGLGIEAEHLERIFDRFYRIPEKSIVDGSGIGLNLTKELVDLWGGSIRAESPVHKNIPNPGTRFIVKLPIDCEGAIR